MTGKTKEAAKAARMVSPSKRSPIKSKKRTPSKERKKKASKSRDNTTQNLESTGKHRETVTDGSNKNLKSKLENQDELYSVMENINGKDLKEATLNELRKTALAWKDFHEDETEILSMSKKELEGQLFEWSMEIKNRMEVDEVPPLQEAPNKGLDLSNVKNIEQLGKFTENDLIKYLHRNRAGTQIGDMSRLPDEDIHYLRKQTMRSIQYDRVKDIKATMKDTLNYLEISEYHEDQHKDLFVLRHHATNWKEYKKESIGNIQNEEIKDVLCEILEEARNELKSKKPPAFEIDLQTQIEMDENFEIKSEEEKTQVKNLIEEILMKHSNDGIRKLFINNVRNLMIAWSKATKQEHEEVKNLPDDDMLQYALDTRQKLWDEYDEASLDENEELLSFLDHIHDKEIITEEDFEKVNRENLESLVFHKRMKHKDYIRKSVISMATTKELINLAMNIFDLEKYSPTISETKYFLGNKELTQNLEGTTTLEKKKHLKNWNKIEGSTTNIDVMDEELIDLEFKEAIVKWSIHPDKKGFDKRIKKMDKEMRYDDDNSLKSTGKPAPLDKSHLIELTSNSTNDEIAKLTSEQKCAWIHKKTSEQNETVQIETLKLWSNNQLNKTISNLLSQSTAKSKKSNLKKDSKYSNSKPPQQSDLHNKIMRPWRYSLFMTTSSNKKGTEGLVNHLSDIFHEMGSFCPGIQLLPWDDDLFENGIDDCEEIPKTINQLKKYFKGVRSPTGVNKQYLRVRLGYPIHSDRPTFEADMIGWCNSREIRMFECALQHPDSKVIGWLAYMPNTIDRNKWCIAANEVYQYANRKNQRKENIKVGLVWKALNGQWDIPQKQKVYSMHVEVASDQAVRVKKFLRMAAQTNHYPLGVRFRLMDEYHQYMKESTKVKYNYLHDKHKTLTKEMRQVESTGILNLDKKIGSTGKTLRDIVTNIRDKKDGRRIFNTIDRKYNNPLVYVAQYRPDKAEMAKAYIFSLATYVKHAYPQHDLGKVFTVDALEESKVETYYPNTQTFITQEDIDLDAVIQDDLDDDSFEYLNVDKVNPFEIQLPEQLKGGEKLYNLSGDDDTASTNPAHSSTISFSNASVHLYDTKSLASEISSISESKKSLKSSTESTKSTNVSSLEEVHQA